MKTFARVVRRYVLATAAIILLLMALGVAALIGLGYYYGTMRADSFRYSSSQIADHLHCDAQGMFVFDTQPAEVWLDGYVWAMVLDEEGQILWRHDLPAALDHPYTVTEVASFTRWYLEDYPVFCQIRDYGMLVLGMPKDSIARYNFWSAHDLLTGIFKNSGLILAAVLVLILAGCLLVSWRSTRSLQVVADGLDVLAGGGTVELPTRGFTGELARRLNQTSEQLRRRNEIIRRRDEARTNWIAGVSHDIRTPLSLILGWAEQLQNDRAVPEAARRKAAGIRDQSEKIRALVEDLNLTSKLQYGAQPLRREACQAGLLLRGLVADFCNGPLAQGCAVELELSPQAENFPLSVDRALLGRALDNVLGNSVRHNAAPVRCWIEAQVEDGGLSITLKDDGTGYPPAVLAALQGEPSEHTPHILGLHVVEQILQAHGGQASFWQNRPHGCRVQLYLPGQKT